ncbi:MAG: IS4 family transposase, partial [Acidobacteriota bacterium]
FHNFLGDTENAIKIQMWCTLIADLLINIIKRQVEKVRKRKWAFANIAGLIRQHLTTYIDLFKFLVDPEKAIITYSLEARQHQLDLFKT